jgi:hypothetical protein
MVLMVTGIWREGVSGAVPYMWVREGGGRKWSTEKGSMPLTGGCCDGSCSLAMMELCRVCCLFW